MASAAYTVLDAVLPEHVVDGIAKQVHVLGMQEVWRDPSMQLAKAFTHADCPTEQLQALRALYPAVKEHVYHGPAPLLTIDAIMDAMDTALGATNPNEDHNRYIDLHTKCFFPHIVIWELSRTHFIMYAASPPSPVIAYGTLFHIGEYMATEDEIVLVRAVTKATGVWREADVYDAVHFMRACMPHLCLHRTHSILWQFKAKGLLQQFSNPIPLKAKAPLPKTWLLGSCMLEAIREVFGHCEPIDNKI